MSEEPTAAAEPAENPESMPSAAEAAFSPAYVPPTNQGARGKTLRRFLIFGGIIVALVGLGVASGLSDKAESDSGGNSLLATRACHGALENQLKDPDSAKYSDETAVVTRNTELGAIWKVQGTVRAKNSFGGYVINTYLCFTTYHSDGQTYEAYIKSLN